VAKHVDAAELRVVAATAFAVAADAVLIAHHLLTLGAHLVTALFRLHVHNSAKKQPGGRGHAGEKVLGGAEKRKNSVR
jgi:hypothetical protein